MVKNQLVGSVIRPARTVITKSYATLESALIAAPKAKRPESRVHPRPGATGLGTRSKGEEFDWERKP